MHKNEGDIVQKSKETTADISASASEEFRGYRYENVTLDVYLLNKLQSKE